MISEGCEIKSFVEQYEEIHKDIEDIKAGIEQIRGVKGTEFAYKDERKSIKILVMNLDDKERQLEILLKTTVQIEHIPNPPYRARI